MGPELVQFEQDFSGFNIAMQGLHNYIGPDDYSSQRVPGEGYYPLKSNNADEQSVEPVWPNSIQNVESDFKITNIEPEKDMVMEPIKYLRRADNNFFGPRTAWYS